MLLNNEIKQILWEDKLEYHYSMQILQEEKMLIKIKMLMYKLTKEIQLFTLVIYLMMFKHNNYNQYSLIEDQYLKFV